MNPADVAQSVLPLTSSDLSLFTLFWHAHWIVKGVMIGLLLCSVWVWAIAIDKTVLYARTRRSMDNFEATFWSGLRPMTPDGPPIIGPSGIPGVWLNLGHGSSGWALSCGSARVLADMMGGRDAGVDLEGLGIERLLQH